MDSQLILVSAFPMLVLEKVLGVRSRTPVLGTSSLILYVQVWEDFNFPCIHFHEDQRVWGNLRPTTKPFISGPLSHPAPSWSNQVWEAFPLFCISWINCTVGQPLPVPVVLSWEVPLPSLGSTRLLWFLTGVKWKCTVGAHWLFPSQTQARVWATDLSYQETDLLASV